MKNVGKSRGYGFVEYNDREHARRAMESLNGYQLGHKRLKVAYARPQCKEIQNANLYVTNLPENWDESKLEAIFQEFGTIVETRILRG